MTKRAILYCGQVREPALRRNVRGKPEKLRGALLPVDDEELGTDDSKIQCNSLDLSFRAARELGVEQDDIHACVFREDLLPQDFVLQNNHPATVDGLRRLVRSLISHAKPDDALLFVAVNHGNAAGLVTADPVDEFGDASLAPRLTPAALDDCLRALPGSQVVVVATCHAGIFLPLSERAGRAVLVACAADEQHLIPREDRAWSSFLEELFGAWCACSYSNIVPHPMRLPLDEAFARAHARLAADKAKTLPLRAGSAEWPA